MRSFLAFILSAASAFAQITVPAVTPPHEPIVAVVTFPAEGDSQVIWEHGPSTKTIQADAKTVHVWAPPGSHTLGATVITIQWENRRFNVLKHAATFVVSGTPGPPPGPVPPIPTPVDDPPGPLAVALGAGVDRLVVAAFYRDLADVVQFSTTIKTTGQFREAQRVAVATLKEVKRFPDSTPEVNKQISDRIAAAVGLDDATLDASKKTALVAALRKIAEDF